MKDLTIGQVMTWHEMVSVLVRGWKRTIASLLTLVGISIDDGWIEAEVKCPTGLGDVGS